LKPKRIRLVAVIMVLIFVLPIAMSVADSLYESHLRDKYGPALPFLQQDFVEVMLDEKGSIVVRP
tara:strand:+ start:92 stop:286 length:195 start_codon:yes stop_codon:yes gene_type:complete